MYCYNDKDKNLLYSSLIFLALYIVLVVIIVRPVSVFDTFWHLQMGIDLVENGLSPWIDHYSVSYLGKDIYPVPVMFQVLLYRFVSFFGEEQGFYFIKLFYITLMMSVLWLYFRKIKASAFVIFILLPLIVSAISMRIIIRPEIFSNVLVVLCLILYLNAQKSFAVKEMVAICVLLLFWTSYHSPILGFIIIFGLFFEKAINKIVHKDECFSWRQWFTWGLLIFLIGFINLNFHGHPIVGQHFLIGMINTVFDGFGKYIQEYRSSYSSQSTNILTHVSWMLSVYVALWSFIKRQYGFAFIVVLLTVLSWSMIRLLPVVILINICVLALYLAQFFNSSHINDLRASVRNLLLVVSVCVSLTACYYLYDKGQFSVESFNNSQSQREARYPVQVADYLKDFKDGGSVLSPLQYGGYLIYKLSPDYKIYFDGRTNILYPVEFLKHNVELWSNVKTVDDVVDRHNISYVSRPNKPEDFVLLRRSRKIKLSFADENFMLFSQSGTAEFPLVSTLLVVPHCWDNSFFQNKLSRYLQREIDLSDEMFSDKQYTLKVTLDFLKAYLAADNKKYFLSSFTFEEKYSDAVRRIALYIAMRDSNKEAVAKVYSDIEFKSHYDILLYSYYLAKNHEYEEAETLAYFFYTLDEVGMVHATHDKFGILGRIFRILKENDQLQKFESSYVDELDANLNKVNYPFDRELSFDFMCK